MLSRLAWGAAAGAAGTTALNAVTYLDMALQARPASSTPEETVRQLEDRTPLTLSDDGPDSEPAQNRRTALGALLGIASGLGTGAAYALVRPKLGRRAPFLLLALAAGLGANVGTVAPMTALGVENPRSWSGSSWLSTCVPHLAYGAVTAAVYERFSPYPRRGV